jgi:putative effector of murein hydrolase LrgA (UPF0299 family)
MPLYDDDLIKLAFRFLHDLFFLALIIRFAWHPRHPRVRDHEFAFTAVMLNITVFFICFTMKKMELSLGMALGLFAIFGVLRYRTNAIRTKDMTYLFIAIGLAVLNALSNNKASYLELLTVNSTIVAAALIGEWMIARVQTSTTESEPAKLRRQTIEYDNLELLAPKRRDDLIDDLRRRTHLPIERVRVNSIDLPNARATLSVWYANGTDD